MYHLRKITLLIAVCSLLFITSCGKDDGDVTVDLTEVDFGFDVSNPPIDQTIISNLSGSSDPNAAQIGGQLTVANLMTVWLSFFNQPDGAQQTNVPIGTCGGDALVYTYTVSSGSESFSIAYQICDADDKYIFQIFFSQNDDPFELFLYAEESKSDLRQGFMELYTTSLGGEVSGSEVVLKYTWNENSDGSFDFVVTDAEGDYKLTINVNADNSGSLAIEEGGVIYYEATWNADGTAGTYTYYDSEGNETESGNWPA